MQAIIWREIKLHYTKVYWLISNFTPPLFYLLFFGFLFSSAIPRIGIDDKTLSYLHFFIPGLVIMQSFFVLSYTLALVNLDRRTKIIEMIHATSTNFYEYFIGRVLSVQFLAFMKILLLLLVADFFLKFPMTPFLSLMLVIGVFLISNLMWFNIGFVLGLLIKTEDVRDIVLQFLTLPITFLSNIYYPVNNIHGVMKVIIDINPLTHATNLIRPALLGTNTLNFQSVNILLVYCILTTMLVYFFINRWRTFQE